MLHTPAGPVELTGLSSEGDLGAVQHIASDSVLSGQQAGGGAATPFQVELASQWQSQLQAEALPDGDYLSISMQ